MGRRISYLNRFPGEVILGGVNVLSTAPNKVYWVSSVTGATTNSGLRYDKPLTTIAAALAKCTASRGDIIFVLPGHVETYSAAAALVLSKAGVSIIGLGNGSNRPVITFATDTAADIDITGANVTIANIVFKNDMDALAAPFDVDAAGFRMIGCDMIDLSTDNTIRWILGDANADDMEIVDCVNRGTDTAGNTAWITLNGADGVVIRGCKSNGDFAAANIEVVTAAATDLLITENHLENANAVDVNIELIASTTGWVSKNFCRIATDGQVTWINTPGNTSLFENYGVNNNGERGIAIGTASV